jgi:hypothetical protein
MLRLHIAHEWLLDPDHLPPIAAHGRMRATIAKRLHGGAPA